MAHHDCQPSPSSPIAEVIAYHGWGYDRDFWAAWFPLLASLDISLKAFDRGYWGHPLQPTFTYPNSCKIIFAHSYGLHLCPAQQLRIADMMVVFASFRNFHPEEARGKRRSQRILNQMIEQFQLNAQSVLDAFWKNCGTSELGISELSMSESGMSEWRKSKALSRQPSLGPLNHALLLNDLKDLGQSLLCVDFMARCPTILLIQGNQDRIVYPARAQVLAQALAPNAQLLTLDGPHAIPLTHHQACWEVLRSHLLSVIPRL